MSKFRKNFNNSPWLGVLGYPLTHSQSKTYHQSKISHLNLNYDFIELEWDPKAFLKNIEMLKKGSFCRGFSVTMPYKEKIIEYLDWLDPLAKAARAVNCVKISKGRWEGYNTDIFGFEKALAYWSPHPPLRTTCVFLGAGATARSLSTWLVQKGYRNFIFQNLTLEKAMSWAQTLKSMARDITVQTVSLGSEIRGKEIFFLNSTPLGFYTDPYDWEKIIQFQGPAWVFDVAYGTSSALLTFAKRRCFYTMDGLPLFQYQADLAFQIWMEGNETSREGAQANRGECIKPSEP